MAAFSPVSLAHRLFFSLPERLLQAPIGQQITDAALLFFTQLFQGFLGNPVADVSLAAGFVLFVMAGLGRAMVIRIGPVTIAFPPKFFGRKSVSRDTPVLPSVHPSNPSLPPAPRISRRDASHLSERRYPQVGETRHHHPIPSRASSSLPGSGHPAHPSSRRYAHIRRAASRENVLPGQTRIWMAALGLCAILLAGCLSWASEQPSARLQIVQTPSSIPATPAPRPLYLAGWRDWNLGGQWSQRAVEMTVDGFHVTNVLLSRGSAPCCMSSAITLLAPNPAAWPDYVIEARVLVDGLNPTARPDRAYFGLLVRATNAYQGLIIGYYNRRPAQALDAAFWSLVGRTIGSSEFHPLDDARDLTSGPPNTPVTQEASHLLRVEVRGSYLRAWLDGAIFAQITDTTFATARLFGLVDSGYQITVLRLTISPIPQ